MRVKAVFFDLFETLITEFSNGKRIAARSYDYMELLGLSADDFKREWSIRQHGRMTGIFPDYFSVIKDISDKRNLPFDADAVTYLYQERLKEKRTPLLNIRPDILDLLEYLRNNRIKIGLISNCTEEEVRYWHESLLAPYFDEIVFSYEIGIAKPDIRIYKAACERLSVTPEESIFVGDGGSGELEGADQAGLRVFHAVWFNPYVESNFKKLDHPKQLTAEIRCLIGTAN